MNQPEQSKKRHATLLGMTLIEFLIVFAIIGILIGALLPAVRQVRQAARRATSMNNIRQLALAIHNYESAHKNLPSACERMGGREHSWEIAIMRFLESNHIDSSLDYSQAWDSPTNAHIFALEYPAFFNPFEPAKYDKQGYSVNHYCANETVLGLGEGKLFEDFDGSDVMLGEVCDGYSPWGKPGNCRPYANGIRFDPTSFGNPQLEGAVVAYVDGSADFIVSKAKRNKQTEPGFRTRAFPLIGESVLSKYSCRKYYSPVYQGGFIEFACRFKGWREDIDTPFTNSGIRRLAKIKNLKGIKLGYHSNVTEAAMADLGKLTGLRYLDLGNVSISNKGILALFPLTNLDELWFDTERISDSELNALKGALPDCKINLIVRQ